MGAVSILGPEGTEGGHPAVEPRESSEPQQMQQPLRLAAAQTGLIPAEPKHLTGSQRAKKPREGTNTSQSPGSHRGEKSRK